MRFTLSVEMDNAAFGDDPRDRRIELLKITGAACAKIEDGCTQGGCRDSNGNLVGGWEITP